MLSEQTTVRELMRLEAERALQLARDRPAPEARARAHVNHVAAAGTDALRLVGIYGVGKRLFAEVRSATRAYMFLSGEHLPLGHAASTDGYRLKELSGACVKLERDSRETVLCLSRPGSR